MLDFGKAVFATDICSLSCCQDDSGDSRAVRILKALAINTWDAGGRVGSFGQEGRMPSREPSFDAKNSLARACGEKPRVVRVLLHNPCFITKNERY